MGTYYRVHTRAPAAPGLQDRVFARLHAVDYYMSTWRDESELSQFNASTHTDWQPLSDFTLDVVAAAQAVSAATGGAFDATVGPLVDLWGFGAASAQAPGTPPDPAAWQRTRASTGYGLLELDRSRGAARKRHAEVRLDLSGIAKGFAVDRVAELLDAEGHQAYLVDVGGELRARGTKADNSPWTVGIENPSKRVREAYAALTLSDQSVATSGNYRHFVDVGDKRYSHIIDPRSGEPVNHELTSVTVLADSTLMADAWSTALMILGPTEGLRVANENGIAACLMALQGTEIDVQKSHAFTADLATV